MKAILKNIEKLSIDSRLKALIAEQGFHSQKDFLKGFNEWLHEHHPEEPTELTERQLSRWMTNDTKKPRRGSWFQFMSEFFDVSEDYLLCVAPSRTPHRKPETAVDFSRFSGELSAADRARFKKWEKIDRFRTLCQSFGYEFIDNQGQEETIVDSYEEINGDLLYRYDIVDTIGTGDIQHTVVLPSGETVIYTDEQIEQILNQIEHFTAFEFFKLKGNQ